MDAFTQDVDEARNYRKEGGIIGACLNEAAQDPDVLNSALAMIDAYTNNHEPKLYYRSPREYRERYAISALRGML